MNAHPDITVVVCTYNRAEMLRDALESLSRLQLSAGRRVEVLVVDNASTDDTAVVVRAFESGAVPVRYIREPQPGVVHARNRGVAESRGEWIAFFDDDQLADPNWLAELHAAALRQNVRCVGGCVTLKLPDSVCRDLSPVCRMLLGETAGRNTARKYSHRFTPGAGNLMLHRSVFEDVGVFDPAFGQRGEDTDLFLRILAAGIGGWFTPTAVVHHVIPPERLSDEFLLRLSRVMAEGMAADERDARGARQYPLWWFARLLQAALVLLPGRLAAWVRGDREMLLGARCRWTIAATSVRDGWRLLWVGPANSEV
ncbi:MAG: glycosyltransferase family 2 protein [Planctomycetaceae bacterium]